MADREKPPSGGTDLQERLRVLTQENQRLTERTEDLLLLSLVAERIDKLDQAEQVIGVLLERASLLKDIPFCGFGKQGPAGFCIEQQYASFDPGDAFTAIHIPAAVLRQAMATPRPLGHGEMSRIQWQPRGLASFSPQAALILPLVSRSHPGGAFIFADDAAHSALAEHQMLLERLIDTLGRRLDNLALFEELHRVNLELDALLQTRSVELQSSQQRFRQLVENAPDAIFLIGADGRFVDANLQACVFAGLDRDALLSSSIWSLIEAPDSSTVEAALAEAVAGERLLLQWTMKTGAGASLPVEISLNRLETGGQSPLIAMARDISLHRQVEGQLLQAQKMESVGRLAGGVAHDFNNLLSTIIGFTEMSLLDLPESSPVYNNLQQVLEAGQRSAGLTRQLLAFSRKQALEMRPLLLADLVQNLARMLQRIIGEDVHLEIQVADGLAPVMADAGQVEQVILNLVVNARDAMPEGGRLLIELAERRVDLAEAMRRDGIRVGNYICLSVQDTGSGMDVATRKQIFEPFFTTKESSHGTGLGLSTAYGIIRQHRGAITVESQPGRGSTFQVLFPADETIQAGNGDQESQATMPGGHELVLVVDDDDAIRGLVTDILERLGYRVLRAASGEEAIQIGRESESTIDLLLSDVVMPHMPGRKLAETWREEHPASRVVLMSGFTEEHEILRKALASGMRFLRKPIAPRDLARIIREALDAPTA